MSKTPEIIKFRIFGSKSCIECEKVTQAFRMHALEFEFLDADDPQNDVICDENKVDRLPHVQAYRLSDGKVLANKRGYTAPAIFLAIVSQALEEIASPRDMHLTGGRRQPPQSIKPKKKDGRGCNGCKNESKNR